jgi:hypothetical protein
MRAYAGHYFSITQSIMLDALRKCLPTTDPQRTVALAALIGAASKCVAAPGHTAQPFQPTATAVRWIIDAWQREPATYVTAEVETISAKYALQRGCAASINAEDLIGKLEQFDVAFIDPPYSGVHYSRFYHVLETLTLGNEVSVTGVGRYPPPGDRPVSEFSRRGQSLRAVQRLLAIAKRRGVRLIITFPETEQSNGLSGADILAQAAHYFSYVEHQKVWSEFSSLGGRGLNGRSARQRRAELVISCA